LLQPGGLPSAAQKVRVQIQKGQLLPKNFCVAPRGWDTKCPPLNCSRHIHLSHREVWDLKQEGLIEVLQEPKNRRDRGIVRLLLTLLSMRDLSCRVGAELAETLDHLALAEERKHEIQIGRLAWSRVMLADIQRTPCSRMPS
jgi:hypothetical protein